MLIHDLNPQECRELLSKLGSGRLACARDNQPYVVPVYFAYDSDRLYGYSTVGRKVEWMRTNPMVCVEADEVHTHFDWQSVVATGRFEEYPDTHEFRDERRHAQHLLEKRFMWWQIAYAANQVRSSAHKAPPIFYCVHIEKITGHRAEPDPTELAAGLTRATTRTS